MASEARVSRPQKRTISGLYGAPTWLYWASRSSRSALKSMKSFDSDPSEGWQWRYGWGSRFVLTESSLVRASWCLIQAVVLLYTATLFPYQLCFLEFRVGGPAPIPEAWRWVDSVVDGLFWTDLVLFFFFSYTDKQGIEILDMRMIARRYLRGIFLINLLACLPPSAFQMMFDTEGEAGNGVNRGLRLLRLHRVSRLLRLNRLAKVITSLQVLKDSERWQRFKSLRSSRIMNFVIGLFWVTHIMACGWYLTAAATLQDPGETWIARRVVARDGMLLIDQGPFDQWLHSMYFVLTVFATVGFGDMFPVTEVEIVYVCLVMVVGSVVHSFLMSGTIKLLTSVDAHEAECKARVALIKGFAAHAKLSPKMLSLMERCARRGLKEGPAGVGQLDAIGLQHLLNGGFFSRALLDHLPNELFDGLLMQNQVLEGPRRTGLALPARLVVFIASVCEEQYFSRLEVVFENADLILSMYLVLKGCFAYVALPDGLGSGEGGRHPSKKAVTNFFADRRLTTFGEAVGKAEARELSPYKLFGPRSYFGDTSGLDVGGRQAYATCESESAVALAVPTFEMAKLAKDFPHCGQLWAHESVRREQHRMRLMQLLTRARPLELLAAETLQDFVRGRLHLRASPVNGSAAEETPSRQRSEETNPSQEPLLRNPERHASRKPSLEAPGYHGPVRRNTSFEAGSREIAAVRREVKALGDRVANLQLSMDDRVAGLQHSLDMILQGMRCPKIELISRC